MLKLRLDGAWTVTQAVHELNADGYATRLETETPPKP